VEQRPVAGEAHWRSEMVAGVRHIFGTSVLRSATLASSAAYLVVGFGETTGFAVNETGLHRPPAFIGVLVSVQGVGALAGGLLAGRTVRRLGESNALGLGLLLWGAGGAGWLSTHLSVVLIGNVVLGFGLPLQAVAFTTLVQRRTPGLLMGRVSAAVDVLVGGPLLLSIALGASLIGIVDYRLLVVVSVVVMTTSGLSLFRSAGKKPQPNVSNP
jgi:hypothetical protein